MTTRSNARMEAELASWLQGLEPAGTPVALRVEAFADLREEEADRRHSTFGWLKPAVSSLGSLSAVVAGVGLVLLIAVVGVVASGSAGGQGSAVAPPIGTQPVPIGAGDGLFGQNSHPIALLLLLAFSAIAGVVLVQRHVWDVLVGVVSGTPEGAPTESGGARSWLSIPRRAGRIAANVVLGDVQAGPLEPLPLRQPWRTVPRLTWALAGLSAVIWVLTMRIVASPPAGVSFPTSPAVAVYSSTVGALLLVAYVWRYPRRDRARRLMLIGALASAANNVSFLALMTSSLASVAVQTVTATEVFSAIAAVAIAAGLAGRSGSLRRPPLLATAVGIGATFFVSMSFPVMAISWIGWGWSLPNLATIVLPPILNWAEQVAGLALLWVAFCALRRGGSWSWRLVFAYAALALLSTLPMTVLSTINNVMMVLGSFGVPVHGTPLALMWWSTLTGCLASTALLVALLSGLRPPVDAEPAPHDELAE